MTAKAIRTSVLTLVYVACPSCKGTRVNYDGDDDCFRCRGSGRVKEEEPPKRKGARP